jgi:translation initiation factor IF-2
MVETKLTRLNKVLREFNISLDRAVEYLSLKGHDVEARPTTKISQDQYNILLNEFQSDKTSKVESHDLSEEKRKEKEELRIKLEKEYEEKLKAKKSVIEAKVQYYLKK